MSRSHRTVSAFRLSSLFALTLTLSIICETYVPGYAQTPLDSSREAFVEEIREDVDRRLEISSESLSHGEIERLYSEEAEAVGIGYGELIELYEEIYVEQKQAQASNPWQQLLPNVGWIVGLPSFLVAIYVTLLKKWTEARFKSAGEWIYRQGAGTRLFRNLALRKYRMALVENNEKLPMPFIKGREPLEMSNVYVPLKVSESQEEKRQAQDINRAQQQIDACRAIADHRRLMVIGEPGSGKSILLKYIAWSYGRGKLSALEKRPVVVLLEMYRLSDPALDEAKLTQEIVSAFERNQFPNAQRFVRSSLTQGNFLLLLDGLDEVNSNVRSRVAGLIRDLLKGKWKKCRAVITCRTAVYEDEFLDVTERKLEVVEFSDQQMRQFLKSWEAEMKTAGKSVNQMMSALRERPLILKLARNPLLLTLIAYLYTEPNFILPRSRTEFYEKSTSILLEQRGYKGPDDYRHNRYEAVEKRRVLQHLALYAQDHSQDLKDRRSLSAVATREQVKVVLPGLDISENETKGILEEIVGRSGLFAKIDGGERYIFPHLTIQEYFAATALQDSEIKLIERFSSDPAAWREVVKLWSSLAVNSTSFVQAIYQRDEVTGFECLAEAREIDQGLANQIIERFKPTLKETQSDDTLIRAFGSVAASNRARGKAVFKSLTQVLFDTTSSEIHRNAAADALSRTNLPKAAACLTQWYGDSEPIIRMGDLAVESLAELAKQGNSKALDDLYKISTPAAATALVPCLWNEEKTISEKSAWYIGDLLRKSDVENALRGYELAMSQQEATDLDWIWQPFEDKISALSFITSRIAFLLQRGLAEPHHKITSSLDHRLILPLCAIQLRPVALSKELLSKIEVLLKRTEDANLEDIYCEGSLQLTSSIPTTEVNAWIRLITALEPKIRLDLISRLLQQSWPSRRQWQYLYQEVDYDLCNSWHYMVLMAVLVILSMIAELQSIYFVVTDPDNNLKISTCSLAIFITMTTRTVTARKEYSFNPDLLWDLCFRGLSTFLSQITKPLRTGIAWKGISHICDYMVEKDNFFVTGLSFGITICTVLVSILDFTTSASTSDVVPNYSDLFDAISTTLAFAFPVIISVAVISTTVRGVFTIGNDYTHGRNEFAVLFLVILAIATIHIDKISEIIVINAVTVAMAIGIAIGLGARIWDTIFFLDPKRRWLRAFSVLAVFAFPLFCWFPIVVILNSFAIHNLLTFFEFPTLPILQQTAILTVLIIVPCTALWWRGQYLNRRSTNFFHGGIIGAVFGLKQQRNPSANVDAPTRRRTA